VCVGSGHSDGRIPYFGCGFTPVLLVLTVYMGSAGRVVLKLELLPYLAV
jgi:hypothetical protein